MNLAVTNAMKSKKLVKVNGALRKEIEHWRFLDSWSNHMPWRDERHISLQLASDASGFAWGGVRLDGQGHGVEEVGDMWLEPILSSPIHVKETCALSHTLRASSAAVQNCCVDVLVDSAVLLGCWERQYANSPAMLQALKDLFWTTVDLNVAISLHYTRSTDNPADTLSRRLSLTAHPHTNNLVARPAGLWRS